MNQLAQFLTPCATSQTLVSRMATRRARYVVDIGAGSGSLLEAAGNRWRSASLIASDIDARTIKMLVARMPRALGRVADGLSYKLPKALEMEEESVDVGVCNPPFFWLDAKASFRNVLRSVDLDDCVSPKRLSSDVIFLAQNLRLLKTGGELAVIVPDGIVTSAYFAPLRAALIERHGLAKVIQLPDKLFKRTEARTHVLYLRKRCTTTKYVELSALEGGVPLRISVDSATKRMDYSFHHMMSRQSQAAVTLRDIGALVQRGALGAAECKMRSLQSFHTTDFKRFPNGLVEFPFDGSFPDRWSLKEGDILVPRVGARCISHVAVVVSGTAVFTDCVYRVRVPQEQTQQVFRALRSSDGVAWRENAAHGTCARLLSKQDVLDLPVGF